MLYHLNFLWEPFGHILATDQFLSNTIKLVSKSSTLSHISSAIASFLMSKKLLWEFSGDIWQTFIF